MSYAIAQDFEYVGKDYWRWRAWIEADGAELDKVKEVVWILHPSFKQSRRVINQRSTNFRLETAGWGIFLLRAEVELKDGETLLLTHNLRLEYPENSGASSQQRSVAPGQTSKLPTVYLSYSTRDARAAGKLRNGLKSAGFEVLDQTRLASGEPWGEALQRMIAQSHAVVGLVGDDEISPVVSGEINAAVASSKPALVLLPTGTSRVKLPSNVRRLEVDVDRIDPMAVVAELRRPG